MILVPITPGVSVGKSSCGTRTGWKGEEGELAELCTQALTVFNRGDLTPATPRVPRLQISLIHWEGELFPTTSLFEEEKKNSHPTKVQMHMWRLGP